MILIGSRALAQHIKIQRDFGDTDIVGTYDEVMDYVKLCRAKVYYPVKGGRKMYIKSRDGNVVEADIAWEGSVEQKLEQFVMADPQTRWTARAGMALPSLDALYMLKMSHRYLKDSPHFLKTMEDIRAMRQAGAVLRPEHLAFYEQRMKDTYVYNLPKLNVSKEAFFDEVSTGVKYTYDHDTIHLAVKHFDKPAYQYYSGGAVWSDKEKFDTVGRAIKLHGVLEESYVLALERSLIPFPGRKTPKEAFDLALMKVCTSITSGWFREFAWENYHDVQALYSDSYVDKFNLAVADGTVKLNGEK